MSNRDKFLLVLGVFAVLEMLIGKINFKRQNRCRQIVFPFTALLYCGVTVYVVCQKYNGLLEVFRMLREQYNLDFMWLVNNTADIWLVNAALMIGYIPVKLATMALAKVLLRKQEIIEFIARDFYELDEDYSEWFLRVKWLHYRTIFLWLTRIATVSGAVYLYFTWYLEKESVFRVYTFPAVFLLLLVEIYNFLNGYTKEEFEHNVLGEDSRAQHISNFYRIRDVYEKLFAPELLSANTGWEYSSKQGILDLLDRLQDSDDDVDQLTAQFFTLNGVENVYDADCIHAVIKLLRHENVVFFNPFYRDLGKYLLLPLVDTLLKNKKCLVIAGRNSTCEDVKDWLAELLKDYAKMSAMWRIANLSIHSPECEVGILSFPQVYDLRVLEANREFFSQSGFVLFLEPSLIVTTGQVGVNMIAQQTRAGGDEPTFCIIDRITDGLVDTMSHLLQTEITEVSAPPVPRSTYTGMTWNADGDYLRQQLFDRQTKYLGNGLELAAVAIKNQVPEVTWFAETKVPIRDIKWIAGQYFPTLCKYMNLPSQQQSIYDKIHFVSNLWCAKEEQEQFVIAEDEFNNIFSSLRMYLTRGKRQSFVNILSENYLLRDYMRCNARLFLSNPNAIPSIVPDYAKTERNTLIRLILEMSMRSVSEKEILNEFALIGINTDDAFHTLARLLEKYTYATEKILTIQSVNRENDGSTVEAQSFFRVLPVNFEDYFADSLKNAYYIVEDEKTDEEYIDAKLFGHVTQVVLPGQFVTYDGKYYLVKYITPGKGVILRRASDLYEGRKYYRQVRKYTFDPSREDEIVNIRTVMDIEIATIRRDFSVSTTGYLELSANNDLRGARLVDFANDPTMPVYQRKFRNKTVLRIKLPDTTDRIRFTICLLWSEIFRTMFPASYPYLAVTTVRPDDIDGMLNYTVYDLDGDIRDEYIYVIEDSEIDLGLLEAVERNIMRIMEITTDFLDWHFEKMREPAQEDPQLKEVELPQDQKKRKATVSMFSRIRKLFGGKKEEEVKIESVEKVENKAPDENKENVKAEAKPDDQQGVSKADDRKDISKEKEQTKQKQPDTQNKNSELEDVDNTDIFEDEGVISDVEFWEERFEEAGIYPRKKSRYQLECYLKFGFDDLDNRLQLDEVFRYLRVRGWSDGNLTQARKREVFGARTLDFEAVNHCDFCGVPISGVSYEKLNDGRIRCNDCSTSAINSVEEFRQLFRQTLRTMEDFYNIDYKVPVTIRMTDAKTIAKGFGSVFTPTTAFAARVLGYAQHANGRYSVFIENGSPRLASIDTMVHEMTHIWQYLNWDQRQIIKIYGKGSNRDIVYEGMAMWSAVQYLYLIGEVSYAAQCEQIAAAREDIYGVGFRLYCEKYPLIKDSALVTNSPFTVFPPL